MAERQQRTEAMSPVDTAWLRMEHPTNLMVITSVMMFDELLDFERLERTIEERLLCFNRFRQCVLNPHGVGGPPQWVEDKYFNLHNHLHRIALPAPNDSIALEELVGQVMSTPLDFARPLWHIYFVEGYKDSGCAIIIRLHHCIADGIALVRVMLSLMSNDPEDLPRASEHKDVGMLERMLQPASFAFNNALGVGNMAWNRAREIVADPSRLLETMQEGAGSVVAANKLLALPVDTPTSLKGKLSTIKRVAWSEPIPLDEVKWVGRFVRGTVNDILLACVAGALRRYLEQRGEPIEGKTIKAVVPVNLRPLDGGLDLGNRFGLVYLELPVGTPDPLDRLIELQTRMDAIKSSPEAFVTFGVLNFMGLVPNQIEQALIEMFGVKATLVFTNVPGPREPIYLCGKPLRQMMFWVPQSGRLGLGISIISYDGRVQVGVATDHGLIPDPHAIVAEFGSEFAMFHQLVAKAEALRSRMPARTI